MENATNVKLRKIRKSDLPYFLKWWKDKELIRLTSGIYEKSDAVLKKYFFDMITSKKSRHFVICLNKKIIGNISLSHRNKTTFEIYIVIGEKEYWGQGFGTAAIKKTLDIAFIKLGYNRAYLEVGPDNKRAIGAYEDCGFIKIGLKKYPNNKFQPIVLKMTLSKKDFLG